MLELRIIVNSDKLNETIRSDKKLILINWKLTNVEKGFKIFE
jgi:hypothetical protein